MRNKRSVTVMFIVGVSCVISNGTAAVESKPAPHIEQHIESYSVGLGATRIIYNSTATSAVIAVNNPNDYPVLVQSKILDEDKKTLASFVVTPPLFRLDGHQQSRIRIIRTGGVEPHGQEALQWLCVTGIPPETGDAWTKDSGSNTQKPASKAATLDVKIKFTRCIKVFVRPATVKGEPSDVANLLTWQRHGNRLMVNNPTPFYMNLQSVTVGGKAVKSLDYVPPMGTKTFAIPEGASGQVQWKIITDLGGDSPLYKAVLP